MALFMLAMLFVIEVEEQTRPPQDYLSEAWMVGSAHPTSTGTSVKIATNLLRFRVEQDDEHDRNQGNYDEYSQKNHFFDFLTR